MKEGSLPMPMLIEHIDAIARRKGRDVLYVIFHERLSQHFDWEASSVRQRIIGWLDENRIEWKPCGHVADGSVLCSYFDQVYIDVPFDETHPDYRRVRDYLEHRHEAPWCARRIPASGAQKPARPVPYPDRRCRGEGVALPKIDYWKHIANLDYHGNTAISVASCP
jgi:hypothetical protein